MRDPSRKRFAKIVSDKDHGLVKPLLQQQKFPLQIVASERIQRAKRLVHQQNLGIRSQRPRHSHPLPLSARQLMRITRRHLGREPNGCMQLVHACTDAFLGQLSILGTSPMFRSTVKCGNSPRPE